MARLRVNEDHPLSATERVRRFRRRRQGRRLEVVLDLGSFMEVERFAQRWGSSRQEVLLAAFRACMPALKQASSAQETFDRVRDALEAFGIQ